MLQTERLLLRRWQECDYEPFIKMNRDVEVMKYFPALLSPEESKAMIERIEKHHQMHGFGLWATQEQTTGAFIGFIGLSVPKFQAHFTPTVEVGWRLAREFWGKGYATEAAKKALDYGFNTIALKEIVSFTAHSNWRSIAVMKRLGMTYEQKDDFFHPNLPQGHPLQKHVLYRLQRG